MMATATKRIVNSGSANQAPKKRGTPTCATGSIAIISIATSCSVVFIRPISAVIAEPARPAKSSALTTGPSSRNNDSATIVPSACSAPKRTIVV